MESAGRAGSWIRATSKGFGYIAASSPLVQRPVKVRRGGDWEELYQWANGISLRGHPTSLRRLIDQLRHLALRDGFTILPHLNSRYGVPDAVRQVSIRSHAKLSFQS